MIVRPFIVLGLALNALGLSMPFIGWLRYVLMSLGVGLILYASLLALQRQDEREE